MPFGWLGKKVRGGRKSGADYQTPADLLDKSSSLGRSQGVVRTEDERALGPESGAHGYIEGAVDARKAAHDQATWRQIAPKYHQVESAGDRANGEDARALHIQDRLVELKEKVLPAAIRQLGEARGKVEAARAGLMAKPRLLRGYFSTPAPVALAGGSVVCFDAFVLHGALVTSGLDVVSVWGTTATVAMAIAAANHAFGVLAGAIGLATPARHRMRVAIVLFVAGFGAMLTAFLLLMMFRAQATSATNEVLESIAKGKVPTHISVFISPLWMGPLQVGGSLAAISLTAFWTMAKEGREYTEQVIAPAVAVQAAAAHEVGKVQADIATSEGRLESAVVSPHEIKAEGAGAAADIATLLAANDAANAGEDGLGGAAKGRYKDSFIRYEKLYRNGGLWRMATPSVRGWFRRRWRSRGRADLRGDAAAIAGRRFEPVPGEWRQPRHHADMPAPSANGSGNGGDPAREEGGIR